MGITVSSQTTIFLFSVVLGIALSLIFDGFRLTNVIFSQTAKKIFIKDIIYFILSAIITFIFILIVNMGEIRVYIISGEIIGWIIYRLTVGSIIYKALFTVIVFIKKYLNKIKRYIISKLPKKQINKLNKRFEKLKRRVIETLKVKINIKGKKHIKNKKQKNILKNNNVM